MKYTVLIAGEEKLTSSVAVCLLLAKQTVNVLTDDVKTCRKEIALHVAAILDRWHITVDMTRLSVNSEPDLQQSYNIAIALTRESLSDKQNMIAKLEKFLSNDCIISINTESILLSNIQHGAENPSRIIGANWVEPAHTTYFLEIISNAGTDNECVRLFTEHARLYWKKDPYIVNTDFSIRTRLICALVREAFYLVENGYVSVEDIDRACRNDAGYYLPFAGNFRYMDLMGTFIYGIVMKDMNPALTKQVHTPGFFKELVKNKFLGMQHHKGFYDYPEDEAGKWKELSGNFSYELREIVEKYHVNEHQSD